MIKEDLLEFFEKNFLDIQDCIYNQTVWVDCQPDGEICKSISKGLIAFANNGNKNAAALYGIIAAYNLSECFSSEIALQLIMNTDSVEVYHEFLEKDFKGIVDEDLYNYMYGFPYIIFMDNVANFFESEEK